MSYQITDHLRREGGLQHPGALKLGCCIPRENSEQLLVRAVEQQELLRRQVLQEAAEADFVKPLRGGSGAH